MSKKKQVPFTSKGILTAIEAMNYLAEGDSWQKAPEYRGLIKGRFGLMVAAMQLRKAEEAGEPSWTPSAAQQRKLDTLGRWLAQEPKARYKDAMAAGLAVYRAKTAARMDKHGTTTKGKGGTPSKSKTPAKAKAKAKGRATPSTTTGTPKTTTKPKSRQTKADLEAKLEVAAKAARMLAEALS